jgi:class 3 adenylate cyclase
MAKIKRFAVTRTFSHALTVTGIATRASVHTDEVEVCGNHIGGPAVHIGARVVAAAGSGQILVSSTVQRAVLPQGAQNSPFGTGT